MSQLSFLPPQALSVAEVTVYLRQLLEGDELLQDVWVQGEISNFSRPSSGHLYFTLKDVSASLRCVMWRSSAARLPALPRDGDAVQVHGSINIYEAGGQYQLYADLIRPAGEGALYQEFLRLKARLEAAGLFDPDRKRPIPAWPHKIGLVTSPTGAALRDMLNVLARRYPLAEVALAPTAVQGAEAPLGIVAALEALNRLEQPDVILLARGGGSLEDLWAFNDERVAYAIAASAAPVISGVGHETDFTIADFVADLRAPTPTAAAELATPDQAELRSELAELAARLERLTQSVLSQLRRETGAIGGRLALRSPLSRLRSERQRLDEIQRRAEAALARRLELDRLRLQSAAQRLQTLNPLAVLERGYALVSRSDGSLLGRAAQAAAGEDLQVRLSDGRLGVRVLNANLDEAGRGD